jgi:4a-hydroxytetrahydrobiopterin dehydratase
MADPDDSTASDLAARHCEACRGDVAPMGEEDAKVWLGRVPGWTMEDPGDPEKPRLRILSKRWTTKDFQGALDLANRFGAIAEEEGHHPELRLSWGWLRARIWTHKAGGLTANDFILAAKYDREA